MKPVIVSTIISDAPSGDIHWYTISFLTPAAYLDVLGFKVHNGYPTYDLAAMGAEETRRDQPRYDVFVCQMGKLYEWDNLQKTDKMIYEEGQLTSMEVSRKENVDRLRLLQQIQPTVAKPTSSREDGIRKRIADRLLKQGKVTQAKVDEMATRKQPRPNYQRELATATQAIQSTKDVLDESPTSPFKYGCFSFYSPRRILGLDKMCFKVRALTADNADTRAAELKQLDIDKGQPPGLSIFQTGYWTPFSEDYALPEDVLLPRLNYGMHLYLTAMNDREERFRTKTQAKPTPPTKAPKPKKAAPVDNRIGASAQDEADITALAAYLEDPELQGKFTTD